MIQKCPHCKRSISSVELKDISCNVNMEPKWNGITYVCPHLDCSSIISVQIDPIAIKTDIIDGLFEKLRNN